MSECNEEDCIHFSAYVMLSCSSPNPILIDEAYKFCKNCKNYKSSMPEFKHIKYKDRFEEV